MAPHGWHRDVPWPILYEMHLTGYVCEEVCKSRDLGNSEGCRQLHSQSGKDQTGSVEEGQPLLGSSWAVSRLLGKAAGFAQDCGWQRVLVFRMGSLTLALGR